MTRLEDIYKLVVTRLEDICKLMVTSLPLDCFYLSGILTPSTSKNTQDNWRKTKTRAAQGEIGNTGRETQIRSRSKKIERKTSTNMTGDGH